jgi:FMN reductase
MSREILFIAGSPSSTSRSSYVAEVLRAHAKREGLPTRTFSLQDFGAADVLLARVDAPEVKGFVDAVKSAAAIVLSTPVYKATYAGGLKAIVDLIPPDALVSRPALGVATTKLGAHGAEVDRAYRALFAFFRARALEPLVVMDDELRIENGEGTFTAPATARVHAAARALFDAVAESVSAR